MPLITVDKLYFSYSERRPVETKGSFWFVFISAFATGMSRQTIFARIPSSAGIGSECRRSAKLKNPSSQPCRTSPCGQMECKYILYSGECVCILRLAEVCSIPAISKFKTQI
jgi:hypothetical protein